MSTTRPQETGTTRTLHVRGRRVAALALLVIALPPTLAACGLLGGATNHGAAPVQIATDQPKQVDATGATVAPVDSGANGGAVTATQRTTQVIVSGGATVTRIGLVTHTLVNTQTFTAVRTQQLTKISIPPPVTNLLTVTATNFVTVTLPGRTVTLPPVTVTVKTP